MTTTLATIYQEVENEVGGLITGVTDSDGAVSKLTVVDSSLGDYDDESNRGPNGLRWLLIKEGDSDGDERKISEFTQSTGTVTVNRAMTAKVLTAMDYEIHRFKPAKILEKFNLAIRNTAYIFQIIQDESEVGVADTYEFDVPSTIIGEPLQISWEILDQGSDPIKPYERIWDWKYDKNAHTVVFDFVVPADRIIRFVGFGYLTALTNEASTTEADKPEISQLYALTLSYLYQEEYNRSTGQSKAHYKLLTEEWEAKAEKIGYALKLNYPQRTVKVHGWTIGNGCGVSARNNAGWACEC